MPDRPAARPPSAARCARARTGRTGLALAFVASALAAALAPTAADAQYQWRDENGRMVFSDQPPPPGIPKQNVVRSPASAPLTLPAARPSGASPAGGSAPVAASAAPGAPGAAPGAASSSSGAAATPVAAAPSSGQGGSGAAWQDKAMEFRKRQADKADAERKAREEADKAQRTAASCENLRTQVRTLESGIRVSEVDRNGERAFLSDEDRARRLETLRRDVRDTCGGKG